jgi:two-component system, OmpR family, phosphate regulon response regulator PhoB
MGAKRVVIVGNEGEITSQIVARLTKEEYSVAVVDKGLAGLQEIRSDPPDLVILDALLAHGEGMRLVSEIRRDASTCTVPIIVLATKAEEGDIAAALAMGADDYIAAPLSMPVLAARVAAVLRRSAVTPAAKEPSVIGPLSIDAEQHVVRVNGSTVSLTVTEFRLLIALTTARGRVLSRAQLIDLAMRETLVASERIIDVHVTSLRRKLGPARHLVRTVRGVGYSLDDALIAAEHAE